MSSTRGGYRGVVTRDAVNAAIASHAGPTVDEIAVGAPSIAPGASLAEALPATLSSDYPVAVISRRRRAGGHVSAAQVGEILTPPSKELEAAAE